MANTGLSRVVPRDLQGDVRQARELWTLYLQGISATEIARQFGLPPSTVRAHISSAAEIVGLLDDTGPGIAELRQLEAARLDALQAAHWELATGVPLREAICQAVESGADEEAVDRLVKRLPVMAAESLAAVQVVLRIMTRRAKLLGLDTDQPVTGVMGAPTVVFSIPAPGQSDLRELGITVDDGPAELR